MTSWTIFGLLVAGVAFFVPTVLGVLDARTVQETWQKKHPGQEFSPARWNGKAWTIAVCAVIGLVSWIVALIGVFVSS